MTSEDKIMAYLSRKNNASEVNACHVFPITKTKVTLGRNPEADINITACFVSRLHACISETNDVWSITDKSINGLFLNGVKLKRDEPRTLQNNDVISFGVNSNIDLAYMFKIESPQISRSPLTKSNAKKPRLENSHPHDIIVLSDDSSDEGPSVSAREHKRRDTSPERLALINEKKALEQRISEMRRELEKTQAETRQEIENKEMELMLKKQEYELKLKMNTMNVKQDLDVKLQTLAVELAAANNEKEKLKNGLKQLEANKTKELAMELERAGLEWTLTEKEKICEELKLKLSEVESQLKDKEAELKKPQLDDQLATKVANTVENELQCSICSELFIKAVTLSCAHSFCEYCINEWKKNKHECPMCRNPIASIVPSLALDNFITQYFITMPADVQERRRESVEERKAAASAASANVPGSSGRSTNSRRMARSHTGRNAITVANRNGRYEIVTQIQLRSGTGVNVRSHTMTVNSRAVSPPPAHQQPAPTTANLAPPAVDMTTDEDDDYWSSDSYRGVDSHSESSESDSGIPGAYYGGYGSCYNCGRRGHWANGCPYL